MFEDKPKHCDESAFRLLKEKGLLHKKDCQYLNKQNYFPLGCGKWNMER